jgi:hypothetical protein
MTTAVAPAPVHATRNLYQRIAAVMDEVGSIPKTGRNTSQNYAFIEQAMMMAILRPLFVRHGVVILPEIVSTAWDRPEGARMVTARCQMRMTVVNVDDPRERIDCLWTGEGADMGDKAVNKAGTSGLKYFLMKLLMLSDKDDPDAESPEEPARERSYAGRADSRPAASKTPSQPVPDPDADDKLQRAHDNILEWVQAYHAVSGELVAMPDGMNLAQATKYLRDLQTRTTDVDAALKQEYKRLQSGRENLKKLTGEDVPVPEKLTLPEAEALLAKLKTSYRAATEAKIAQSAGVAR